LFQEPELFPSSFVIGPPLSLMTTTSARSGYPIYPDRAIPFALVLGL
jgi:hypothetical protein